MINFDERMEGLNKAEKYQDMRNASRPRVLKDFKGADLRPYTKDIFGDRALTTIELEVFSNQDPKAAPHIYRMQQLVGLRARNVLANALGLDSEKELKSFLEGVLVEKQEAHFVNPSELKEQFIALVS